MKVKEIESTSKEILQNIGIRLRSTREYKRLPIKYMAEILETTPEQYLEIENGKSQLDGFQIFILKKVLDVSINWLIVGDEDIENEKLINLIRVIDNSTQAEMNN
jgi:transcriptional regulator with XRE-family HTH domain